MFESATSVVSDCCFNGFYIFTIINCNYYFKIELLSRSVYIKCHLNGPPSRDLTEMIVVKTQLNGRSVTPNWSLILDY